MVAFEFEFVFEFAFEFVFEFANACTFVRHPLFFSTPPPLCFYLKG